MANRRPPLRPIKPRRDPRSAPAPRATRGWEPVAAWYDELVGDRGSEYHREVVIPGLLRLIPPRAGARLLDVACGQGVVARAFAERGAKVVAVDASRSLIEAARERQSREDRGGRSGRASVDFRVGDARRLGDVGGAGSFDLATCVLALANLAPLAPVFAGVSAALAPGGRFAAVLMHPCFRIPRASSWGWDDEQAGQYRRVDRYLSSNHVDIRVHPGADPSQTVPAYHRPLEAYVNALSAAGLVIDRLEEWPSHKTSPAGPRKRALDESRDEIPMFLALRARRVVLIDTGRVSG